MDINQIFERCKPGRKQEDRHIYFFLNKSGLGDQIARLTILKYVTETYPWVKLKVVAPDYFMDLGKHCLPEIRWFTFAQAQQLKKRFGNEVAIMADKDGLTTMRMPLIFQAYTALLDHIPMNPKHWNYVKCPLVGVESFNLPENYVIIPIMHTAPVREFPARIIKGIADYCITKGYTPVFVGRTEAPAHNGQILKGFTKFDASEYIDKGAISLIDKTTTVELASIMSKAKAVIGLDNGLLHLAAITDVPIVFGFTSVDPQHRVPYRHDICGWNTEIVVPTMDCRYCQSNMNFVYDHDFKFCYFGHYDCINQMKAEDYTNALDRVIENDKRKNI